MRFDVVVIIGLFAVVVGLLLYLPFHIYFDVRRSRGLPPAAGQLGKPLPRWFVVGSLITMGIMFTGFSQRYLAPDTWFGQAMQQPQGRRLFGLFTALAFAAAIVGREFFMRRGRRRRLGNGAPPENTPFSS